MTRAAKRLLVWCAVVVLLALPAVAGETRASDPVLDVLEAEIARAMETLSSSGTPPYFVGIELVESETVQVTGESGGLHGYAPARRRFVDVDVRVGGRELDSSHPLRSGDDSSGTSGRWVPLGDSPRAIRQAVWLEIDRRYQAARERWARVEAENKVLVVEELSQDLAEVQPVRSVGERPVLQFDAATVEGAVRSASTVLASDPVVVEGGVAFAGTAETRWFVSSEGTRLRHGTPLYRFELSAVTIAADGERIRLSHNYDAHDAAGLPPADTLVAEAWRLVDSLRALSAAPLEEPYSGPAILSDVAAGVFFHEIFGHRVEGHRLKQVDNAQTFRQRIGERILPDFLSVHDDPTIARVAGVDLNGTYRFDNQGVPAERVTLVERGVLRGFLESRSPVARDRAPNGHGRRQQGYHPVSRQANLIVTPAESIADAELRRRLIDMARAQGKPYGLYIDEIEGGFTFTSREMPNAFSIDVVRAWRVFVDGRPDELIRGVNLIGTPLEAFSRIRAAGELHRPFNGSCGAESGWVPVAAAAPALLVESIETQRKSKDQATPPLLPAPLGRALRPVAGGAP